MKKLAYVVATPTTYRAFLEKHAMALRDEYEITLIADFKDYISMADFEGVSTIQVSIRRKIAIWYDLMALIRLTAIMRREKFDIVHSITPKAGLLASLAGWLANRPHRVHTYTGQVWATGKGFTKWLLKTMDKITLFCTTNALADSRSQASFLSAEGFAKQIRVLGDGAIAGIDISRFRPDKRARAAVRSAHSLAADDFVFVFLGRLNHDKGIMDLLEGFEKAELARHCKLMIVGPDEANLVPVIKKSQLYQEGRVVIVGSTTRPEHELNAGDVICLPSYREGFGMSILEAAAVRLPAIASRIYGLTDAVVEGETGIMHNAGNTDEIAKCLNVFARNPGQAQRMGVAARARVIDTFSPERVTNDLRTFYRELLNWELVERTR